MRFFDIRLKVEDGKLLSTPTPLPEHVTNNPPAAYHGIRPERSTLQHELSTLSAFLRAHPSETLVVSIKEETPPWDVSFSRLVYEAFTEPAWRDLWRFDDGVPVLGQVRGRGTVFSRFDQGDEPRTWPQGMGIHPTTWPDSRREGFEWDCHGTTVRTQDW